MKMVFDAMKRHAQERGEKIAFRDRAQSVTWAELKQEVESRMGAFHALGDVIGLARGNSVENIIDNLAASFSGKTVVPLPFFFSQQQILHIKGQLGVAQVIDDKTILPRAIPRDKYNGCRKVTFTSGSSGTPKGVVLTDKEIDETLASLCRVIRVTPHDRYLSILPQSQLLEEICGLYLPVIQGIETVIDASLTMTLFQADPQKLARGISDSGATMTLIVPALLAQWVKAPLPNSMRFVAMGGAPVSRALLDSAAELGLPVYEGYGLSECGSVCALNTPDAIRRGSVGQLLPHVKASFDDGELIISSPANMKGYFGGAEQDRAWRTRDIGHIDKEGFLYIRGRKDSRIILPNGRNLSPEWVEASLDHLAGIVGSALVLHEGKLVLLVEGSTQDLSQQLNHLPDYAQPEIIAFLKPGSGILRAGGAVDRDQAATIADKFTKKGNTNETSNNIDNGCKFRHRAGAGNSCGKCRRQADIGWAQSVPA